MMNNRGFTLVELIIVVVVLGILGGFTISFLGNVVKTYVLAREQGNLYSEGTYIMERIARELNDAQTIVTPAAATSSNTLRFTRPHPSPVDVSFSQSERQLRRNADLIGTSVKTFSVTRNAAGGGSLSESITILLELDKLNDATVPVFSLKTTIVPNNFNNGYVDHSFNGDYYENIK